MNLGDLLFFVCFFLGGAGVTWAYQTRLKSIEARLIGLEQYSAARAAAYGHEAVKKSLNPAETARKHQPSRPVIKPKKGQRK